MCNNKRKLHECVQWKQTLNSILHDKAALDFFVVHSSIVSLFGNAGQTNYGAGNALEDALMCLLFKATGIGKSICWGALDLGLFSKGNVATVIDSLGMKVLKKNEILQCFETALGLAHKPVVSFTKWDWSRFLRGAAVNRLTMAQYEPSLNRFNHYLTKRDTTAGGASSRYRIFTPFN